MVATSNRVRWRVSTTLPIMSASANRRGAPCVLVRELPGARYHRAQIPYVSQGEGTGRVVRHVEQFYCPTFESQDRLG